MTRSIIFAAILVASAVSSAQTTTTRSGKAQGLIPDPHQTDSAMTAETRSVYDSVSENLIKAAKGMPENLYTFKPVDDARTFGELVEHIATVQTTLCGNLNGTKRKLASQDHSKETRIANLVSSIGDCHQAFAELSAENAKVMVEAPAGQITHLAAFVYIINHASEEYGELSVYLRLNHLLPPTRDDVAKGSGGKAMPTKTAK